MINISMLLNVTLAFTQKFRLFTVYLKITCNYLITAKTKEKPLHMSNYLGNNEQSSISILIGKFEIL